MSRSEGHRFDICSPDDRDRLVASLHYNNEQWCEINVESGELTLEIYPRRTGEPWMFVFKDAMHLLNEASAKLTMMELE